MDSKQASQATTGLVIVGIGLMLLAGQIDSGWALDISRMWPIVFVVIGASKLASARSFATGLWFLAMGGIFFMHTSGFLRLSESWPLFIVLTGLSMLFSRENCGKDGEDVKPVEEGKVRT